MASYTVGLRAVKEADAAGVRTFMHREMRYMQDGGADGLDVAVGTLSALRQFVLWNVGPEAIEQELVDLAQLLLYGEV